jgi:hypothetical protein
VHGLFSRFKDTNIPLGHYGVGVEGMEIEVFSQTTLPPLNEKWEVNKVMRHSSMRSR